VLQSPTQGSNISPEVTLTWHVQPNFNIYGAFKTGYKSGGTSNAETLPVVTDIKTQLQFLPETSLGGEIGAKGEWMNGRLRATLDIYDYTFKDFQVESLAFLPTGAPTFHVTNAAQAETKGAELQGSYLITADLSLRGHIDYNNAIYASFKNAPCTNDQLGDFAPGCVTSTVDGATVQTQDLSGKALPHAPKWFIGGGATYTVNVGRGLRLQFDGDANFQSSFVRTYGEAADGTQAAYVMLNAAVRLTSPLKGWEVALIGTNLSNVQVIDGIGNSPGAQPGVYDAQVSQPRTITAQLSYQF
jgi:iron complex outermembrane receptor protein